MMSRHDTRLWITVEDNDVELSVEYDFVRGKPGCFYLRNGDPGYPPEPDEYDIRDIKIITEKTEEPAPAWLHNLLVNNDDFMDRLAEKHHAA